MSEVVWSEALDGAAVPLPEVVETAPVFAFAGRAAELDPLVSAWKEVTRATAAWC